MPLLAGKHQIPTQPLPPDQTGAVLWTPLSYPRTNPPLTTLVTNEFAHWNRTDPRGAKSPDWDMDSGSLFYTDDGVYWTGKVDAKEPNRDSSKGTNSAIFRLTTRRNDFTDVRVSFDLWLEELKQTRSTPAKPWDGVHIFLAYQDQRDLYYASVARRDGRVVAKRKTPGGDSNGGTYTELADEKSGYSLKRKTWTPVAATIRTTGAGVEVSIERGGKVIYRAVDPSGQLKAGAVGIRGDNAEIRFRNFEVRSA